MRKVYVNRVVDSANLRGLPLLVVLCTTVILVLDGLDIQIISLVAPLLSTEFGISIAGLGPVLASALVGMAIGGFALGALGDRLGRRPGLLISVALFAVSTLLTATAHGVYALAFWRLLTGIGLGGAIPNAMALLAEFSGRRWRNYSIAAAVIGVPIGGMLGATLASHVLPLEGWRTMFVIGGLLPCVAFAGVYFVLPESPGFLAMKPNRRDALVRVLNRLAPDERYSAADDFDLFGSPSRAATVANLLTGELGRETAGLWLLFLTNMFVIFTFFSWTPTILRSFGLPMSVAVHGSWIFNVAGVCGGLISAWVISRVGSRWPTVALALAGIATFCEMSWLLRVAATTQRPIDQNALMAAIAVAGFVMIGIQTVAYRLGTHLYPTAIRSSGVGWAGGLGRVGGILSSLIAGWVLATSSGAGLFVVLAAAVGLSLSGVLAIRRHLAPSSGEF